MARLKEILWKRSDRRQKRQLRLRYSSHIYFWTIHFSCNGDAPSSAPIHGTAYLFQPSAPHPTLREHFDGNTVWQGAFFTRCFIYLKRFNCFDLIQTQPTRLKLGAYWKEKENIKIFLVASFLGLHFFLCSCSHQFSKP